ncbi:uncharacterized protein LOC126793929 [Argentina anserina]|uniref:uncharacterized protein LOC126793929 n=1 Tax=Argentina anserina TaxID=57926 RepID=UPI0021768186|nr:uncharacterized protein LOC126793929 [Potentilla anserina]
MGKILHPNVASRPPKDSWEEQLYLSVGKELWEKLSDSNNKCIYLYQNVARWNDSAGREAFDNAKTRFLAKIKDVPRNVPSPDPDAYIDEIDWSDSSNVEVILEEEENSEWRNEGDFVLEGFEVLYPSFCVGWGPEIWYKAKEEEVKKDAGEEKAWEAYWEANLAGAVGGGGGGGGNCGGKYNSSSRRCIPKMAVAVDGGRVKCSGRR